MHTRTQQHQKNKKESKQNQKIIKTKMCNQKIKLKHHNETQTKWRE